MSLFAAMLFCLAPVAIDGDTAKCGGPKGPYSIRIWGVLAPEMARPPLISTPEAIAARAALQMRIGGGIACEPRGASYSRTVALCYDGTGRDVGMQLLKVDKTVTEACTFTQNRTLFPIGYYETCAPLPPR